MMVYLIFLDLISDKTDKVFLQSLNVLLSFLGSLSDICVRMRYRIMRTDLLIHLANVISFFSDLDDNEEMVSHVFFSLADQSHIQCFLYIFHFRY